MGHNLLWEDSPSSCVQGGGRRWEAGLATVPGGSSEQQDMLVAAGTKAGMADVAQKSEGVVATVTNGSWGLAVRWAGSVGLHDSAKRPALGGSACFETDRPTPALTEQAARPGTTPNLCLFTLKNGIMLSILQSCLEG